MPDGLTAEEEIAWISDRLTGYSPAAGSPVWAYRENLAERERALERLQPGAALLRLAQADFKRPDPRDYRSPVIGGMPPAKPPESGPSPNASPEPERDAQARYVVWLVIGIALFVTGVGALYSMYSSPSAGFVPLVVALCLAVSGAYIGLAAVFNLWLPRPPIRRIRHHIKVSAAVLVGLVFIASLVAWKFPRKAVSPDNSMSSVTPTSAAPHATAQATPKTTVAIATPKRPKQMPLTVHGHAILDVSPDKLDSLCEGYTSLQCDKLRKPYEDKWVRWTGVVNDVDDSPGVSLHVPSPSSYLGYTSVGIIFKESERNEVVHLRVGDKITIVGRLVYGMGDILEDAELLRNETTDKPIR